METLIVIAGIFILIYAASAHMKNKNRNSAELQTRKNEIEQSPKNEVSPITSIQARSTSKKKYSIDWEKIPDEFVVFDLETTGLKTNKSPVDIIELSAIKFNKESYLKNGDYEIYSNLIFPHRGGLNEEAQKINKISQSMLNKSARHMHEVLPEFINFAGKRLLVAHNVDFDRWFLQREISDQGISKRFKYECTLQLSRKALPHLKNHKLATIADYLNIETNGAHRALRDCEMTLEIYLITKSIITQEVLPTNRKIILSDDFIEEYIGKNIIFTGTLDRFDRETAELMAKRIGMIVKSSISKKLDYVVEGDSPGSKIIKAKELGLKIIDEKEFLKMISKK